MRLILDQRSKMWIAKKFIEEHNHGAISLSRLHLLKANCKVSKIKKQLMKSFRGANISTSKAIIFFEHENGCYNRIGCIEKDIRSWERDVQQFLKEHMDKC